MSNISTNSGRYKKGQEYRIKEPVKKDQPIIDEKSRKLPIRKWSNDRVHDELSSFIHEFSYLKDTPDNTSEQELQNSQLQSYNVYAAHTARHGPYPLNNSTSSKSKHNQKTLKARRKSVDWKDLKRGSPTVRRKRSSSPESHTTESSNYASREEQFRQTHPEKHKIIVKRHKPQRTFKSKDRNNKRGRLRSRSQSRISVLKSRSPHRQKQKKSQSEHSGFRTRSRKKHRQRSQSKRSLVKLMPFYCQKQKRKPKQNIIMKRREPIPEVKKLQVKELIPSDTPTIVTLYPKQKRVIGKYEPDFLADPSLPCKCFQCMRKYESLMKFPPQLVPVPHPVTCSHPPTITECPRKQDWWCDNGVYSVPCYNPFVDEYCVTPEWYLNSCEQTENKYYNSVFMKFKCFGQYIDSNITQYFHSILDKSIYC